MVPVLSASNWLAFSIEKNESVVTISTLTLHLYKDASYSAMPAKEILPKEYS
jgi:hypothetical protein